MQPLAIDPRDSRPLSERVYDAVRDAIIDGALEPDHPLVQEALATDLGVSRTPVREALARLAQEGFVTAASGGRYLVNRLSEDDIVHVYETRFALESLAMRQACGRHTPAQLARLRSLVEEMAGDAAAPAAVHFELNRRFHLALMEPCGNPILLQVIYKLWDHPVNRRITRAYASDRAHVGQMVSEHRDLLAAAEEQDCEQLVHLAVRHMVVGYQETLPLTLADSVVLANAPSLRHNDVHD